MMALVFCCTNVKAYDCEVNGIYYNLNNDTHTAEVTKKTERGNSYSGDVVVPQSFLYSNKTYTVNAIGSGAFSYSDNLLSVILPNSIKTIGSNAFSGCKNCKSIEILNGVTSIKDGAFSGCTGLTSLTIPQSVSSIDDYSFDDCGCNMESIVVDASNSYFDSRNNCNAIIRKSDMKLLLGCKNTVIPNGVKKIGRWAFMRCVDLKSINFPTSLIEIGEDAFYGCSGLTELSIPSSVTKFGGGGNPFKQCGGLQSISVDINNPVYDSRNNCNAIIKKSDDRIIRGCNNTVIPNSVVSIGFSAFSECDQLYTINIPDGVNTIEDYAFDGCKKLSLVVSEIVNPFDISDNVFNGIASNAILQVPQGTKSLYQAFTGWTKNFKEIIEVSAVTYSLSIKATGNGSASYNGSNIKNKTSTFSVDERTNATITFSPDNGYRIKSVKVNSTDVTSSVSNSSYTVSNISRNTTVEVEFEAIPSNQYKSLDDYIQELTTTTVDDGEFIQISPKITNIKKIYVDLTKGTTDNKYCYMWIYNESVTRNIGISSALQSSSTNLNIGDNWYSIKKFADEEKYSWLYYNPDNSNEVIIDVEQYLGGYGYIEKWQKNFGTSCVVNIVTNQYKSLDDYIRESSTTTVDNGEFIQISPKITNIKKIHVDLTKGTTDNKYCYMWIYNESVTRNIGISSALQSSSTNLNIGDNWYSIKKFADEEKYSWLYYNPDNSNEVIIDVEQYLGGYGYIEKWQKNFGTSCIVNIITGNSDIPPTTYTLSINVMGNGSAIYDGTSIKNRSASFTVNEGTDATISFIPNNGYRIKSVKVDNSDVTSNLSGNTYTVSNISSNITVEVEFEIIPPTIYTLSITATGNGSASYDGTSVRGKSNTFNVEGGTSATITFSPDNGNKIKSVKVNNTDVISQVMNNSYTVSNISGNTIVEVEFEEIISELTYAGIYYKVESEAQQTVKVVSGDYGLSLEVPASFTAKNKEWNVVGVEAEVLDNPELAAIIWNPDVAFSGKVNNPNLLLYVKDKKYAPEDIKNVVVNGEAEIIELIDAENGNNFYCPQTFKAKRISYVHRYSMKTGFKTCQGWETIVLPFDVATILSATGTEIVPYSAWQQGSNSRPFWLYSLNSDRWKAESSIKANLPYIISMPNNEEYEASYNLSGDIQFTSSNVQVISSENLSAGKCGNKQLVPNYQNKVASQDIYALNVNSQLNTNTDTSVEGSAFIRSLRQVRPFEAYMAIEDNAGARRAIPVFDDDATGIPSIPVSIDRRNDAIYNLNGQRVNSMSRGVYIQNGKKIIKK